MQFVRSTTNNNDNNNSNNNNNNNKLRDNKNLQQIQSSHRHVHKVRPFSK